MLTYQRAGNDGRVVMVADEQGETARAALKTTMAETLDLRAVESMLRTRVDYKLDRDLKRRAEEHGGA